MGQSSQSTIFQLDTRDEDHAPIRVSGPSMGGEQGIVKAKAMKEKLSFYYKGFRDTPSSPSAGSLHKVIPRELIRQ